jgi:hypothetical protein
MAAIKARSDMKELKDINAELKRLTLKAKELKTKKTAIEQNITQYLQKTDQQGIKYEDLVVFPAEKKLRERKKAAEKQQDVVRLLENSGIADSKGLYKQIQEALKGKEQVKSSLHIKSSTK